MVIAQMNPRDQVAAVRRIKNACARPSLADEAIYSYSRGGSKIEGPTIRLAEVLAQCWGNMQFGIRELKQKNGESEVQAFAWDVETNTRTERIFTVPHMRHTKSGSYKLEDPRDIYEMVANNGARRQRACILAIIPGDVVEMAVNACNDTIRTSVDMSPERIQALLDKLKEHGVSRSQVEKYIQRHIEAMEPTQAVRLGKICRSIRDGIGTPSDWFEPEEGDKPKAGNEGAKEELKKRSKKKSAVAAKTEEKVESSESDEIAKEQEKILADEAAESGELPLDNKDKGND